MSSALHVLPSLSRGGPGRALLTKLAALDALQDAPAPAIASLRAADPVMRERATELGVRLVEEPAAGALADELAAADLVEVHFWNSPELYEMLTRRLPPMRLVVWAHVGGIEPPQVITSDLVELADRAFATGTISSGVDGVGELETIPPVLDPGRIGGRAGGGGDRFTVGYIGTVDPIKMHPDFAALASRVRVEGVRFVVCGSGYGFRGLAADARRLGIRDRLELRGYVEDVGAELAGFDVFGYPLCRENYSTAELVLQEAMAAGVPPVVLPYGGAAQVVDDGRTGMVARDEDDYVHRLELLASDPGLRARLGAAAREHAAAIWSPVVVARRWLAVYEGLLAEPKRERAWPGPVASSGAALFLASLGAAGDEFRMSHAGDVEADAAVRSCAPVMVRGDGSLLDYRRRFPDDPHLRLWLGLALAGQGRPALAAGELAAARRLGIDPARVELPLAAITGAAA